MHRCTLKKLVLSHVNRVINKDRCVDERNARPLPNVYSDNLSTCANAILLYNERAQHIPRTAEVLHIYQKLLVQ